MNVGDGVEASLVRGPYCQLDVGLCDVDVFLHWNSAAEEGAGVGLKLDLQGSLRVSTTSSGAGATSRIAVIVQTGGFLSGGRRGATLDDKEDCYGRATVALTRAIEHTYIISPLDMAGLIGMAQTLGVYHYGYFTLNKQDIQYHGPTAHPSDQTAVLEWGLGSPFTPQDKPPLTIAMLVKSGDIRKWKRYRLVVARKEKLHLDQRVLAVLDATTVTMDSFLAPFPGSIYMGMQLMGIDHRCGCVQLSKGPPHWSMPEAGTESPFTLASMLGNWSSCRAYTTSMPTGFTQNWRPSSICPWRDGRKRWLMKVGTKLQVNPRLKLKKAAQMLKAPLQVTLTGSR